jgi:hypothetical protein
MLVKSHSKLVSISPPLRLARITKFSARAQKISRILNLFRYQWMENCFALEKSDGKKERNGVKIAQIQSIASNRREMKLLFAFFCSSKT